ncbi:MAG TPA: N-acetylmuramoyl-L-alanine amidase, partial [Candidatus Limnocylindria bacterium]
MTGPALRPRHRARLLLAALLPLALVACGNDASPSPSASGPAGTASPSADASQSPIGQVIPAPGSDSAVYAPNPGALVVAIDAGHGGCLDWGVPDPRERGVHYSEKTMTLAIAQQLRSLLEEQGVTVVLTRDDDLALAGDDYPD